MSKFTNITMTVDESIQHYWPTNSAIDSTGKLQNAPNMRTSLNFQEIWQYRTQCRAVVEYFSIAGRFPAMEDILCQTPHPPTWPHWGCPPPAGRWNKVPPLLACSPPQGCTLVPQSATTTTTPTTLWTAATFLLLSVSLPTLLVLSVWRPWNLAWPSSGAHKCGSFRAGPQILSKLSKK